MSYSGLERHRHTHCLSPTLTNTLAKKKKSVGRTEAREAREARKKSVAVVLSIQEGRQYAIRYPAPKSQEVVAVAWSSSSKDGQKQQSSENPHPGGK